MITVGPNFPSLGVNDASIGSIAWGSPGSITADDGVSDSLFLGGSSVSNYLKGTGFGFAIPLGAVINGIMLEVKCFARFGQGQDYSVKLAKGGIIGGANNSVSTRMPNGALAYMSYGGSTDLWSRSWTAADINSSTFGAVWACAGAPADTMSVDAFRVSVYYTTVMAGNVPTVALRNAVYRGMYR